MNQLKKLKEIWKQKSIKCSLTFHYFLIVKTLNWAPKVRVLFRISIWKLIFCSQKKFVSWFGFKIFCGESLSISCFKFVLFYAIIKYLQTCIQYVPHGHRHPISMAIHRAIESLSFRQKSMISVQMFCTMLAEVKKDLWYCLIFLNYKWGRRYINQRRPKITLTKFSFTKFQDQTATCNSNS